MFGVDFSNCQKHGFFVTLANYSLRQLRKNINNSMNAICRMTLKKSNDAYKVADKNCHTKRKKQMYKNKFVKFRDGNAGKKCFNKHCDANKHPELKVEMDEVDITQKENPDWRIL